METWFILLVSLCICALIKALLSPSTNKTNTIPIPPGPHQIPIISSLTWIQKSFAELEPLLRTLIAKHGPIVSIPVGSHPSVFIADRSLAHYVLIQNASLFSDRPKPLPTFKLLSSNRHNINTASYGDTWRTLRRNLTTEILQPSRLKSFSEIRGRVLQTLINRLKSASETTDSVRVVDHIHYAMFCLLVFMCFGENISEEKIDDVKRVERKLLLSTDSFSILNFCPKLTRILLWKRWEELLKLRKDQSDVLLPLIRERKQLKDEGRTSSDSVVCYVDTLLDLELPEEKRKLSEEEIITLCSELLTAGTDTTSTTLQWIMANLVKYPHVQSRLAKEIMEGVGSEEKVREVKEGDLKGIKYLKAVVLEGLRRHPPGHFLLPHAVTEDVVLNGYLVPKNGSVNFMLAEIGRDPKVWEDPMEFKPERFMNMQDEKFDITGSKEIKMMPFGAGRRICPAYNMAILHLEYFLANLVLNFDWKLPEGGYVDLEEKQEFTFVMKNELQVHLSPRI